MTFLFSSNNSTQHDFDMIRNENDFNSIRVFHLVTRNIADRMSSEQATVIRLMNDIFSCYLMICGQEKEGKF